MNYKEIETAEHARQLLAEGRLIEKCAFQDIDFREMALAANCRFENCLFMGCKFTKDMKGRIDGSNLVFSHIDVPYNAFRSQLYTAETLYEGYQPGMPESYAGCFDNRVYQHYLKMGKTATDVKETLARTLHDRAISAAVHDLLAQYDEKKIVGIMGGHGLLRTDEVYRKIVLISKQLAEQGYLMVSGGGPGAMEATHLGASLAGSPCEKADEALAILAEAPSYKDPLWLDTAFKVLSSLIPHPSSTPSHTSSDSLSLKLPSPVGEGLGVRPGVGAASLAVPTWLYGHEPSTPFASHIAKYFENAIREDSILTIAKGGIVYTPGSAGTMQEIFQDAVQNHYLSFGYASPMIFLDTDYWTSKMPVYPLLQQLSATGRYKNLILSIGDKVEEIVAATVAFTANEQ